MISTLDYLNLVVESCDARTAHFYRLRRNAKWVFVDGCTVDCSGALEDADSPDSFEYFDSLTSIAKRTKTDFCIIDDEGFFNNAALIYIRFSKLTIACVAVWGFRQNTEFRSISRRLNKKYLRDLKEHNDKIYFSSETHFIDVNLDRSRICQTIETFTSAFQVSSVVVLPDNSDINRSNVLVNGGWDGSESRDRLVRDRRLRRILSGTASPSAKLMQESGKVVSIDNYKNVLYCSDGPVYCFRSVLLPWQKYILLFSWHDGLALFPGEFKTLFSIVEKTSLAAFLYLDHTRQMQVQSDRVARNLTFKSDKIYQFTRHEIKNLSSSASSTVESLRDDFSEFARKQKQPVPKAIKKRLSSLFEKLSKIRDALNSLGALSADDLESQLTTFNVRKQIQSITEGLSDEFWKRKMSPPEVTGTSGKIIGYPQIFDQIFVNLFENSLRAFDRKIGAGATWISIDIESENGKLLLTYKDSAGGIRLQAFKDTEETKISNEAEAEEIFKIGTSTSSGSGFGMALIKSCTQVHGGDINLKKNTETGVQFQIVLNRTPIPAPDALLILRTVGR